MQEVERDTMASFHLLHWSYLGLGRCKGYLSVP
jgi:hypothetical protein